MSKITKQKGSNHNVHGRDTSHKPLSSKKQLGPAREPVGLIKDDNSNGTLVHAYKIIQDAAAFDHFPCVTPVTSLKVALEDALVALQKSSSINDSKLRMTVLHALDGAYELLSSEDMVPADSGETQVCSLLVQLLSFESIREDSTMMEKCYLAIEVLCRSDELDQGPQKTTNIGVFREANMCAVIIRSWKSHGNSSASFIEAVMRAIVNLADDEASKFQLGEAGCCETTWRLHGLANAAISKASMLAIGRLAYDNAANRARFWKGGGYKVVMAVLREFMSKNEGVCFGSLVAFINLFEDKLGSKKYLRDDGRYREVIAALGIHGRTSSRICSVCRTIISNHSLDSSACLRILEAKPCECLVAVLREFGSTSQKACDSTVFAIMPLLHHDDAFDESFCASGGCEELMAALRTYGPANAILRIGIVTILFTFLSNDRFGISERLGKSGFCEEVIGVLRSTRTTQVEKLELHTVSIIMTMITKLTGCLDRTSAMNRARFGRAQGCLVHATEVVTALRVYGAIDERICASGIIAIMHLSVDPDNMMRLREAGANEELVSAMRVHGSTHFEVFNAVLFALQIVGKDAAARKRFRQAGGWEAVIAAVRVHGPRDAEAYSEAMKVINNMGSDPADRKRLMEAGGFEEVAAALRAHGSTSASLCSMAMRIIITLTLGSDAAASMRLRQAGVCQEVIAALRVHGSADVELCEMVMRAIAVLAADADCRARFRDLGGCEEVKAAFRVHVRTSAEVREASIRAIASLAAARFEDYNRAIARAANRIENLCWLLRDRRRIIYCYSRNMSYLEYNFLSELEC